MLKESDLWSEIPPALKGMKARQIIWHLFNTNDIPICKNENCNKQVTWNNDRNNYTTYCSSKCRANCQIYKTTLANKNISSHGYKYSFQNPEHQQLRKETMMLSYGYEYSFQNKDILNKAILQNKITGRINAVSTLQTNHNVNYPGELKVSVESLVTLKNKHQLTQLLTEFTAGALARKLNVDRNTIIRYINLHQISEDIICKKFQGFEKNVIDSLNINNVILNDRTVINPYELDIWLPDYNLAIECNGDYWHSDKFKSKDYHYNKWKLCNDVGIRLIQLSESDWLNNELKIKLLLKSALQQKEKGIGARKCLISQIDAKTARPFVDTYHLQGFVGGTSHFGAFYNTQLVGVMTFGWTRGTKESRRFELKRWVTDEYTHPGLFSKTFKVAQNLLKFPSVVSFSANEWFTGNIYETCGFTKGNIMPPSYSYIYNNVRVHCSNFTKANIKKKYPDIYNNNMTEFEMTDILRLLRIWDAGKIEWIWNA